MKKRLWMILSLIAALGLAGCVPTPSNEADEAVQEEAGDQEEETVIIPTYQVEDKYYRTLLPFKPSASRGLIVNNLHTKYDMKEVEEGLLRLSTQQYSPDDHFFQEGQYITEEMATSWIGRKSKDNKEGLNPSADGLSEDEIPEKAPIYLAHIVEQNFLTMTKDDKVRLDGVSIGLAMNSVYYGRNGKDVDISQKELEDQGTKMAETIVKRLRKVEGLEKVPIVVGLFKQESNNAIIPGNYFATATSTKGNKLSGWKKVDEEFVVFPSPDDDEKHRDVNMAFQKFKQEIDNYFPSFVNVVGRGHYIGGTLQSLEIEVPIQFFGTSETIGFVQYLAGIVKKDLPNVPIEISVTSINGPEALIVLDKDEEEPYVHIYGY